jgi:2-desacetyl-2-hydroxyethyl bacteriochlorophyllide A dehydrogenase
MSFFDEFGGERNFNLVGKDDAMKAAQYQGSQRVRVIEKSLRSLGDGEILLNVDVCGICGTDVHIVEGTSRSSPPVILGHEYAGVVADAGHGTSFAVGDRVGVDPNIACGVCFYCRRGLVHLCTALKALGVDIDGGMAESSIVPVSQLYRLPAGFPPEQSAFIEPVSCAIHGIDLARIRTGDTVAILGGGTIGLLMLQLARASGAARIIVSEPLPRKRLLARTLGADLALDPGTDDVAAAVRDTTEVGADVVIECVGTPRTAELALGLARRGGTVEFFGVCPMGMTIPLEPNAVYARELTIVGSYVNPHTYGRAISVLEAGLVQVDSFQIKSFPLDSVEEALACQREGRATKSIVRPQ